MKAGSFLGIVLIGLELLVALLKRGFDCRQPREDRRTKIAENAASQLNNNQCLERHERQEISPKAAHAEPDRAENKGRPVPGECKSALVADDLEVPFVVSLADSDKLLDYGTVIVVICSDFFCVCCHESSVPAMTPFKMSFFVITPDVPISSS